MVRLDKVKASAALTRGLQSEDHHRLRARLRTFVEVLPKEYRYVFEMRLASWHQKKIYDILRQADGALCIHDISGEPSPAKDIADFVYLRFHGPEGEYLL